MKKSKNLTKVNTVYLEYSEIQDLYDQIISLKKEVRDTREKNDKETILIEQGSLFGSSYIVETNDEACEKLAKDLKNAREVVLKSRAELNEIHDEFEAMTLLEFRRWRNKRR